jgi:hypothetical protein
MSSFEYALLNAGISIVDTGGLSKWRQTAPFIKNAGDTLSLNYTNTGGRNGVFDIVIKIYEKGK